MAKFGVGQPVRRVEDQRLITGQGRYTDDINLPVRPIWSSCARRTPHARVTAVRTDAAKAAPGVLAVITGADMDGGRRQRHPLLRADEEPGRQRGAAARSIRSWSSDKVRYVGDNVAFVVAETAAQAKDAAELVEVDYAPIDSVADTAGALSRQGDRRCMTSARATSPMTGTTATTARSTRPSPRRRTSPSSS